MFFGEKSGLSRTDQIRYPIFHRLTEEQYSNYWRPHDIEISQDKLDYESLPANVKHVFVNNLAYQSLLDSAQSRAILLAFLPWISNPELESCVKVWAFFEEIHNKSYEYILKNLFNDPTPFNDAILKNKAIVSRAASICSYYDDFIRFSNMIKVHGYSDSQTLFEHKRLAYIAMVSVYALESIRFYVTFAYTFAIAQQDVMLGNAKQMKMIARDETLHVGISLNILKIWPKEDSDFLKIAELEKNTVSHIFDQCVQEEKQWASYLLSEGSMLGINETLMFGSIEARANARLKALGMDNRYSTKSDPFARWMANWMSTSSEQTAPQETDKDDYKMSTIDRDVDEDSLIIDF